MKKNTSARAIFGTIVIVDSPSFLCYNWGNIKGMSKSINYAKAAKILLSDDKDARIALCEESFELFFKYYYAEYHHYPTPDFHKEMFQDLHNLVEGKCKEQLWLMFRESAKSSIAKAFLVWLICYEKKHYIVYDCYNKKNAEQALIDVANVLQTNDRIIRDFGHLFFSAKKKEEEGTRQQRMGEFITTNGIKVAAMSTQESPRGKVFKQYRPDFYILDDFETFATKDSVAMTDSVVEHIIELLGGISPSASILYLGNYITSTGSVNAIKRRLENSENGAVRIGNVMDEDGNIVWPEKYTHTEQEARDYNSKLEDTNKFKVSLESKREQLGINFEPEMMNNPFTLSDLVFNQDRVKKLMEEKEAPIRDKGEERWYEGYNPVHRYAIGADIAKGVGKDNSATVGLDFTGDKAKVVVSFKSNKEDPIALAYRIASQGESLGNCLVAPENNSIGYATVGKLRELYPENKIYQYQKKDKAKQGSPTDYGWVTTSANKADMMYDLINAFNNGELQIYDERILAEMKEYTHGDIHASTAEVDKRAKLGGSHFDMLIALAIAYQMKTSTRPGGSSERARERRNMRKQMSRKSFR